MKTNNIPAVMQLKSLLELTAEPSLEIHPSVIKDFILIEKPSIGHSVLIPRQYFGSYGEVDYWYTFLSTSANTREPMYKFRPLNRRERVYEVFYEMLKPIRFEEGVEDEKAKSR